MARRLIAGALLAVLGAVPWRAPAQPLPKPQLDCQRFKERAHRLACDAANRGEAKAEVVVGLYFVSGNGVPIDYATASHLFRLAADQGDATGQAYLGSMYASGRGVAQDDAEAVRLLRSAVDKGNAVGQVDLGDMYVNGRGVAKNNEEADRLYRLAAQQDNVDGMNSLAWRLAVDGKNLDEALNWATRAVALRPQRGDVQDTLSWILYRQGKIEQALAHARQAVAMAPRCASCQDHLGDILAASGDAAGARVHWRRALDLSVGEAPDPDWDRAAVKKKLSAP